LGQNARWLQQLEEFSFHLSHIKGTSHANADALSRHPCLSKPSCTACHPELEQQKLSARGARLVTSPETESSVGRGSNGLESAGSGGADRQSHPVDRHQSPSVAPADEANSIDDAASDTPNLVVLTTTVPSNESADSSAPDMQMCGWDRDSLIASQQTDPDIKVIVSLLERSAEKPAWRDVELQSADVKSPYTEWPRLAFRSGLLCWQYCLADCLATSVPSRVRQSCKHRHDWNKSAKEPTGLVGVELAGLPTPLTFHPLPSIPFHLAYKLYRWIFPLPSYPFHPSQEL